MNRFPGRRSADFLQVYLVTGMDDGDSVMVQPMKRLYRSLGTQLNSVSRTVVFHIVNQHDPSWLQQMEAHDQICECISCMMGAIYIGDIEGLRLQPKQHLLTLSHPYIYPPTGKRCVLQEPIFKTKEILSGFAFNVVFCSTLESVHAYQVSIGWEEE